MASCRLEVKIQSMNANGRLSLATTFQSSRWLSNPGAAIGQHVRAHRRASVERRARTPGPKSGRAGRAWMATRSVAETDGLDFLALELERFDLLISSMRPLPCTDAGSTRDAARAPGTRGVGRVRRRCHPPDRAGRSCAVVPRNPFYGAAPRQIANFTIS